MARFKNEYRYAPRFGQPEHRYEARLALLTLQPWGVFDTRNRSFVAFASFGREESAAEYAALLNREYEAFVKEAE